MLTPDEIRALREYTEMTQVQMAQLFRVRPADVIAWENGTLEPDTDQHGPTRTSPEIQSKEDAF